MQDLMRLLMTGNGMLSWDALLDYINGAYKWVMPDLLHKVDNACMEEDK